MNNSLQSTRAMLYFLFDKGVDFDTDEINSVFDDIANGWESYWAFDEEQSKEKFKSAYLKVVIILDDNKWLAEYFLLNSN